MVESVAIVVEGSYKTCELSFSEPIIDMICVTLYQGANVFVL